MTKIKFFCKPKDRSLSEEEQLNNWKYLVSKRKRLSKGILKSMEEIKNERKNK